MMRQTVIVTGASGNLGQAVIRKFLNEGYQVIATLVPNDPVSIDMDDQHLDKAVVDLMNEEAAQRLVQEVVQKYGRIDAAVCTVGGFTMGTLADTAAADIQKQYRINFETAYHIARPAFIQMLQQNSGRLFFIGSKPGLNAAFSKGMVAYGLSKALIFRLAEMMNAEAAGKNVVTSVVVPGTIDTRQNREAMPGADFSAWITPDAIASVIYFYCTAAAAGIREPVIKLYNNA